MLTVTIDYDHDLTCPNEDDCQWRLHSFSNRHVNYTDPDEFQLYRNRKGELASRNRSLQRKLKEGYAFILSYFEHGDCVWSRSGHGPRCQWDSVSVAGILIWEHKRSEIGAKDYQALAKDADSFLRTYTDWCNGQGFYYSVEDEDGETIDSCGGFYASDETYMLENIAESLIGEEFEVEGDADDLEDDLRSIVAAKEKKLEEEGRLAQIIQERKERKQEEEDNDLALCHS